MTMLSETMRLELAPLNVRVITLVAGGTKSKISDNGPPPESLPPTSPYLAVEKHIATKMDFKQMPTEIFAEQVVDDVVRGTTGKVWHSVGSKTVRYAVPLMPQWIFVSSSWKLLTQRALMLFRTRSCLHMDEDCSTCRIRRSRHISERQCLRTYDQDSGGKSESDASRVLVHVLRASVPSVEYIARSLALCAQLEQPVQPPIHHLSTSTLMMATNGNQSATGLLELPGGETALLCPLTSLY
jgi:hypothetical protein